ncbi:Phospholipase D [Psidium guajava]|nr:Phospholipase D [Psidium guajava]
MKRILSTHSKVLRFSEHLFALPGVFAPKRRTVRMYVSTSHLEFAVFCLITPDGDLRVSLASH